MAEQRRKIKYEKLCTLYAFLIMDKKRTIDRLPLLLKDDIIWILKNDFGREPDEDDEEVDEDQD